MGALWAQEVGENDYPSIEEVDPLKVEDFDGAWRAELRDEEVDDAACDKGADGELTNEDIEQQAAAMSSAAVDDDEMMEVSGSKRQKAPDGEAIKKPEFEALSAQQASGGKAEFRRIPVPPHRYTPLRAARKCGVCSVHQ